VLEREPDNDTALGGVLRCMVAMGEIENARGFVDDMGDRTRLKTPIAAAISALELAEAVTHNADLDVARAHAEANPTDTQAKFDLGMALFAANKREEAVQTMIEIIRKDREWNEDGARTQLIKFFEAWGPMDPASVAGRRALSTVLFA
jgi:putative thioredoxin